MERKEFERVTPESVGIPSRAIETLLDSLESSDECEPHGLMVMRHGKVCAEGCWAPYAAGVPHTLFSLTKTYTATAVGIAYTEGLLGLDDRVVDHFPEYASVGPEENRAVTIRQALSMASGKPEHRSDTADWRRHFFEIPFTAEPGAKFEYSCEDTHILMGIVQKVTGQGLHDCLRPLLFDRIGIDAGRLKWVYLPDGSEVGAGGLFATLEDSLRLMKLYLDGGVWNGRRILAGDYVAQATSMQIENDGYGYGFQIHMGSRPGSFYGAGALGQAAIVAPDLDMVVVLYQAGRYFKSGEPQNRKTFRSAEHYFHGTGSIFRILLPAVTPGALPEDPGAGARVAKRLSTLSLGNPASRSLPPLAAAVSGRRCTVTSGTFTLRNNIWNHITNNEPFTRVTGASWFSFSFDRPDECRFRCLEHGREVALLVGLDGVRRLNSYRLDNTCIDKVVLDGMWSSGDTFLLNVRWIETCFSMSVTFTFTDARVDASLDRIWGDYNAHPLRQGTVIAELEAPEMPGS